MKNNAAGFIIIYITYPNLKSAKKVTAHVMKKRLVVCANFFPIQNSYWWKGKIEHSREVVTILKTAKKNWPAVRSSVKKLHPYETPCIMKLDVQANADYETWINNETK